MTTGANWQGNVAPGGLGTDNLVFGTIAGSQFVVKIGIPVSAAFNNITFTDPTRPEYEFVGDSVTLLLNGNVTVGPTTNGSRVIFHNGLNLQLSAGAHTVDIAPDLIAGHLLEVYSPVSGAGSLVKTGTGILALRNIAGHTGGTIIKNGTIELRDQGAINHSGASLVIGETTGDDALLTAPFGTDISAKNATLGLGAGSKGTVDILGGSDWISETLVIGAAGTGIFNYEGGEVTTTTNAILGQAATGIGTASFTGGAKWNITNQLTIGDLGQGTLTTDASTFTAQNVVLGAALTGKGTTTFVNGVWTITNQLTIGAAGEGTFTVDDSGIIVSATAVLGAAATGDGTATFMNGSQWNISGQLTIGNAGQGLLTLNSSSMTAQNVVLGAAAGSTGAVILQNGSAWSSNTLTVGDAGIGTLQRSGGSGAMTTQTATLGAAATGTGTVSLTGGANWTNFNALKIGDAGTGTVSISSEGQMEAGDTFLGYSTGGTGILLIANGGGFSTNSGQMVVGRLGSGLLAVSENGHLSIDDGAGMLLLGSDVGGTGTLVIGSSSMGSTAGPGFLNLATIKTGNGTGTIVFNTNTDANQPYELTRDGTPIVIEGNTQIVNTAGYNVLMAPAGFTGNTTITGGTLALGVSNALPATGNVSVFAAGADSTVTLDLKENNQTVANLSLGGIDGSAFSQVDIGSDGTLTFTGTLSFLAAGDPQGALISNGSLILGGANIIDVGDSTNAGHDLAITSDIGGAGSGLTKTGAGTLVLSGTSTYTFGTIIQNGTLAPLANGSLPATRDVFLSPIAGVTARLYLGDTAQSIGTLTLGGTGANTSSQARIEMGSAGNLTLGGNILYSNLGNPLGATITDGTITLNANRTFDVEDSPTAAIDLSISSVIAGTGFGITKSNSGTLQLSGTSTYTGSTSIIGGALMISSDGNLGAAPGTVVANHLTLRNNATLQATASFFLNPNRGIFLDTGGGKLSVDSGVTLDYGGVIAGSSVLTKAGAGILHLDGANTYSGGTIITGGTLSVGAASALPNTNLLINPTTGTGTLDLNGLAQSLSSLTLSGGSAAASQVLIGSGGNLTIGNLNYNAGSNPLGGTISGGTLTFPTSQLIMVNDSGNAVVDLAISSNIAGGGVGGLIKNGDGTLQFSGTNTYTGGTTVRAGTLLLGATGALPTGADVTVDAFSAGTTAVLNLSTFSQSIGALSFSGGTTSSASQVQIGPGATLTLGGPLAYFSAGSPLGAAIQGAGTLDLGGATRTFNIQDSTSAAADLTVATTLAGTGGINKTGSGTLVLSGANTYTGATALNAGFLAIGNDNGLGAAPGTPTPSHLQFNTGTLVASSSFTLNANRGIAFGASGGTIATNSGVTLTYGGIIAGVGGFAKAGQGTLSLSGANTYGGTTAISDGSISLTASNVLPFGNNVVISAAGAGTNASLQLTGTSQGIGALTLGGTTGTSTSSVNIGAGGVLALGSTLGYSATNNPAGATIANGTLLLGNNLLFAVGNSTSTTSDLTITSVIAGSGFGFTKSGTGTLVLSGLNTFTGGMTVNDGIVRLTANNTLSGQNVVINKLAVAGSSTLTVDGGTAQSIGSLTFGGPGGNSGSVNTLSIGSGATVTLGGNVTFDSLVSIQGASISGGALALGGNRTFAIGDSSNAINDLTVSAEISGPGFGLTKSGGGVLALVGINTYTGATTLTNGTLAIGADSALGTAPASPTPGHLIFNGGTLETNSTFTLDSDRGVSLSGSGFVNTGSSTTLTYDGIMAGTGGLFKVGAGTLVLGGANTYSGGTTISGGKLVVSNASGLGTGTLTFNGGQLDLAAGITLANTLNFGGGAAKIGGNGTFGSAITAGTNITLAPGSSPGTTTFTGALTWATGGSYDFEVVSANGTAGTGYDTIVVTGAGSFNITATSGGKFNLNLLSLSNATTPGNVSDFLSSGTYTWQIASSANPITGFSADAFNINTSGFTNSLGTGNFSVSINGSNTAIFLNFSPIPEPSTYALLALGAGAVFYTVRRRRRA